MAIDNKTTRVCVIGAGFYGLEAAKTYLQVDPTISLTVLEAEDSLGGTWSRRRIYPTLRAQQKYGVYEYSDFPMDTTGVADPHTTFIPAEKLQEHMEQYAVRFGIKERIRFNAKVTKLERATGGGWNIWIQGDTAPSTFDKVIVGTGLTSNPSLPELDTTGFEPPAFHTRELGAHYAWLTSPEVSTITIYGGGKSAIDAMYMCVKNGKQVNWIIRPDSVGNGAAPQLAADILGRNTNDVISSRMGAMLQPQLDSCEGWWYRFLHSGSGLGYWLHWKYWGWLSSILMAYAGYDKSENMARLRPKNVDHAAFWVNVPTSITNQPESIAFIHSGEKVKVIRSEITALEGTYVVLSDGERLHTDAVVFATGYNKSEPIYSPELAAELGVVTDLATYPPHLREKWDNLDMLADQEVVRLFPRLANPPMPNNKPVKNAPCRLYKDILPPELARKNDRSLVFAGAVGVASTAIFSGPSALWGVAWLTDNLSLDELGVSQAEIEWEIAIRVAFGRRRYTVAGVYGTYALFEWLPKIDALLMQLGVQPRRIKSVLKDFFLPYQASHYRRIVDEWMQLRGLK